MADSSFSRPHSFKQFFKQWITSHWQLVIIVLVGVLIPLQVFLILALEIWRHQGGLQWDIAILNKVHTIATPQLDAFARALTNFGTAWGVFPVAALVSIALLFYRRWRSLTYFLITTVGCAVINTSAKVFLHRDRPSLWDHSSVYGFSFPSGHAMSSMVLVAALTVLLWKTRWQGLAIGLGSLFVVAIGWTRLYLGVHYPSDILAGWMLTLAWVMSVSLIVRPNFQPPNVLNDHEDSVPEDELIPS